MYTISNYGVTGFEMQRWRMNFKKTSFHPQRLHYEKAFQHKVAPSLPLHGKTQVAGNQAILSTIGESWLPATSDETVNTLQHCREVTRWWHDQWQLLHATCSQLASGYLSRRFQLMYCHPLKCFVSTLANSKIFLPVLNESEICLYNGEEKVLCTSSKMPVISWSIVPLNTGSKIYGEMFHNLPYWLLL